MKVNAFSRIYLAIVIFIIAIPIIGVAATQQNILLILADDFSTDGLQLYHNNPGATYPKMPNVERLAKTGVTFRNAYGYPTCSPTRCALMTGRYGFRTGVGFALANPNGPKMQPTEFTIPEALTAAGSPVRHGMVGKWHLSFGPNDPNNAIGGFSHFSGGLLGELLSYTNWPVKTINGVNHSNYTVYATTDNYNDATNWISNQDGNSWFLYLCFNACHEPFHEPPADLHTKGNIIGDPDRRPRPFYEAMAESMDTMIGRLLNFLGDQTNRTTVIFLGDNGTPSSVIQPPYDENHAKATLYEGGIRVPLIISGPTVHQPNRWSDALVSTVDMHPTILEMSGVNLAQVLPSHLVFDGVSLMPIITNANYAAPERYILSENFGTTVPSDVAGRATRNNRYKLIVFDNGTQEMYDLQSDINEQTNMLNRTLSVSEQGQYSKLMERLRSWNVIPSPLITGMTRSHVAFGVNTSHASNVVCRLWSNNSVGYPVWNLVSNAIINQTSATTTYLSDPLALKYSQYYQVTLQPVGYSSGSLGINWKTNRFD